MSPSLKGTLETILIVEDDQAVLRVVTAILQRVSYPKLGRLRRTWPYGYTINPHAANLRPGFRPVSEGQA